MSTYLTPRNIFLAIFLGVTGLIGFGLILQHVEHLEPCPMCILQRYAFVGAGVVALAAAVHNPAGMARRVYAALMALAALAGAGVAARQSWIQHFPPKMLDCGPDLSYMVNGFPLSQSLPMIFQGTGDCTKVEWSFLGLSIAEWALVWFAAIAAAGIYLAFSRRQSGMR